MTDATPALLARIAAALERLAPPPAPTPQFDGARLYRYEAPAGATVSSARPITPWRSTCWSGWSGRRPGSWRT